MKTHISKILAIASFTCLIYSCTDFVEVNNYNGIPADNFITNVDNAQSALNGVYNGLYGQNLYYFGIYYYTNFATNELEFRAVAEDVKPLVNFGYYDGSTYIAGYWKDWYSMISRANDVCTKIHTLRNSGNLTTDENVKLSRMIGECNFLRAFSYFFLTRSFGDKLPSHPAYNPNELGVPIMDSLIVSNEQLKIPRNTLKECWDKVIRDFETAYTLLPNNWSSDKLGAATKGAAAGYLGQVYMYLKDYPKAKEWFDKALLCGNQTGSEYQLTENYAWNFDFQHENNSESIFEVQFQTITDYTVLASYLWRRLGPDTKGFGMVNVSNEYVNKFSMGYELTQEGYENLMPQTIRGATDIVLRELLNIYQPYIGVQVVTAIDFFNQYKGNWDTLGDQINTLLRNAGYRLNVKTEENWGTVNYYMLQEIINKSLGADPRMYDSFYVPGRDSIALDWAGTQVQPYTPKYYGFKKYIPYNAVESWASDGHSGADGFNSINQRIFRLADLYLQYAEACYKTGDLDNAKKYLNKVRRRAWGFPFTDTSLTTPQSVDYPSASDSGDFMDALISEREKELCLEGILWFDYLRWNKAESLFQDRGFDPTKHHRLPIPLSERQIVGVNKLIQNSGY